MADENKQFGSLVGCLFWLLILGLIIGGCVWRSHVCDDECECTPDRCCEASDSCLSDKPCSCLSDANDWSAPRCEEKKEDCNDMYPFALAMMISGYALIASPFIFFLFCYVYWAIKALYKLCFNAIRRCMKPKASEVELGTVETTAQ